MYLEKVLGVPYFGVLIIRVLLFRCLGYCIRVPYFRKLPNGLEDLRAYLEVHAYLSVEFLSPLLWVISLVTILLTPLVTTPEPPSKGSVKGSIRVTLP